MEFFAEQATRDFILGMNPDMHLCGPKNMPV
jgi:hypothetical protein